jgi:hypothetical protein
MSCGDTSMNATVSGLKSYFDCSGQLSLPNCQAIVPRAIVKESAKRMPEAEARYDGGGREKKKKKGDRS